MNDLDRYASEVVKQKIPAGKFHRLACVRHQRDRKREGTSQFSYRLDEDRIDQFCRFAQQLRHYKGKWSGQLIELTPIQKFRLGSVVGWVHRKTGLRRFRTAYNELPRKQGKSLEAAIVALYITFFDQEAGAEGYTIATKRDQAKIVFNDAKKLVLSSGLKGRIQVRVSNMHRDSTSSKLEPLGADHDSTDGLNPSLIITDEFHAHKDRGLIDVMETATGARSQPLHFQITTAGNNPVSPCGDQHDYACKILERTLVDETFFAIICHADIEDDWKDEATWKKANPHYGVSVNPDDMRSLCRKAKAMPSAAAAFKQKRLNLWVNAYQPWLSMEGWERGNAEPIDIDTLEHAQCYVGIDLASQIDLCAMTFVFPPTKDREKWYLMPWAWTPEDTLVERSHRDRAPYDVWVQQGHLTATSGTRVDHQLIRAVLRDQREKYDIQTIGFDPWHADTLISQLQMEDGFGEQQVLAVPQTYAGMSAAALRFEAEVLDGNVCSNANPVMQWCSSNAVVQQDGKGNVYPTKRKSRGRIDPIMAAIMGMALFVKSPAESLNVYLDRGVRQLNA
mgnify:FL=1